MTDASFSDGLTLLADQADQKLAQRKFNEAISLLQDCVSRIESAGNKLKFNEESIYAQLSNVLVVVGDYDLAIKNLTDAVAKHPRSNRLKLDLVRIALLNNNWSSEQALEMLESIEPPLIGFELSMFRTNICNIQSEGNLERVNRLKSTFKHIGLLPPPREI